MSERTEGALALARFFEDTGNGYSKSEVAMVCGIHATSISGILSGERRPTVDQAAALERITKIPAIAWAHR